MDHNLILNATSVLSRIVKTSHYVSKERFDLAAKVKFNLEDPKRLDRLYGLYNKACQALHLFEHEDLQEDLFLAVDIAMAAWPGKTVFYKHVPGLENKSDSFVDKRKYFYSIEGEAIVREAEINLRDAVSLHLLSELLECKDVELKSVVTYLGELQRSGERRRDGQDVVYPYYDGDIVFLFGDPGDRVFYDWYRTDAGVYIATDEGWRKLQYVRGRGYLNKDGEPEYENNNHYTDYKFEDLGRNFRFVGNIYKDPAVLIDTEEDEERN